MAKNKIKKYKELCAENSCVYEREEKKWHIHILKTGGKWVGNSPSDSFNEK